MQKGKIDPVVQNLKRHYHKIVQQFSPVLLPYAYLHSGNIATASINIANILHSCIVEYPDQLKASLIDDRSTSTRLHLLKMLFNIQKKDPQNVNSLFPPGTLPFVFQLSLLERWTLHAVFDVQNCLGPEQLEYVTDISHSQIQANYWSLMAKAKNKFQAELIYPDCRQWPMILSVISNLEKSVPDLQKHHLNDCNLCQEAHLHHLELLKILGRQISRPAFTYDIQQQILNLILTSGIPEHKAWYEKYWKKMYDWGIFSEPTN